MHVRILTSIASADWSYSPGQIVDVDAHHAAAWCASGVAEAMPAPVKPTKATK